jgi:hypothetical protein
MGKDKNKFNHNDLGHGHFCQRCKFHWLCSFKKCVKKVEGDEFAPFYIETRPELVDVEICKFCKCLSDKKCAEIRESIPSYHFGRQDERVAKSL